MSLDPELRVNILTASVGVNLELKCDIAGEPKPKYVWRRNGINLAALRTEVNIHEVVLLRKKGDLSKCN